MIITKDEARKSRGRRRRPAVQPVGDKPTVLLPAEGQLLNKRYRIVNRIGVGGMGVVYKVTDEKWNDRVCALKTLPPELIHSSSAIKRLGREAEAAVDLHHPNIMGIFDFVHGDECSFIVMEYLSGPDLDEALAERERFACEEMISIAEQVCPALDYAHSRGVIHRDIKPGNLIFTSEGDSQVVKLADFGIAFQLQKTMAKMTGQDFTGGTLHYMSPEQIAGKKAGPQCDQYSLAATLYELVEGQPPFEGAGIMLMRQIEEKTPPEPESVSPDVQKALMRALSKNPADRYSSCTEFLEALKSDAEDLASLFIPEDDEEDRKKPLKTANEPGKKTKSLIEDEEEESSSVTIVMLFIFFAVLMFTGGLITVGVFSYLNP